MVWPFSKSDSDAAGSPASSEPAPPTPSTANTDADLPPFLLDSFDVAKLHPMAGLDKALEVIQLEEDAVNELPGSKGLLPSRGWTDDLCYGSGTMYMGGLAIGGTSGLIRGIRSTPSNLPPKLKLNSILNNITQRGPYIGNTAGILAISYNVFNGILDATRSYHDAYNSIAAGTITGILYNSARGVRQMAISGALMGAAAGVWSYVSSSL